MRCAFAPRIEYGLTVPHLEVRDGRVVAEGGSIRLDLSMPVDSAGEEGAVTGEFTVEEGQRLTFSLAYSPLQGIDTSSDLDPDHALAETIEGWRSWVGVHTPYQGPHAAAVQRSALVLQALTYQPSGAVLAAATTSLPAEIGGGDNWDYRYAWLRDLSLTTQALWIGACPDEVGRFLQFIADAAGQPAEGDRVQIMYGLDGRRWVPEHELDHLRGYADSRPVRIGNAAWDQSQLDVMGEVLDLALRYRDYLDPMEDRTRRLLRWLAEEAARTWQTEDAGWESRDGGRHYTTSKVMCWVALDRAVQLADLLDASVLLMPLIGFIDADDDRMLATIRAIQRTLVRDGLVYRWDGDANGFVLCTAWLAECLAMAGQPQAAAELLDRLVARATDLGLYAEQIQPHTGRHVGNFPQAFSHVGIINAAWRLGQTDHQERG